MPIYTFECKSCNNKQDEIYSFEQRDTLTSCNVCSMPCIRVPSSFAMHFVTTSEKQAKDKGLVRIEPGMDKQAADNKKHIQEKKRMAIRKSVEKSVMEFDIPGH